VNTALRFGFRHALNPMRAGFELQLGVYVVAFDSRDHLLVATVFTGTLGKNLDPPALPFGITRVHAKQVAGKDRRLVTTSAGTNLEEDVTAVLRIFWQQHALQACLDFPKLSSGLLDFLLSHLAHIRITVLEQRLSAFKVGLQLEIFAVGIDDRL